MAPAWREFPDECVRFRLFLRRVPACAQPRRHRRVHAGNPPRAENRRLGAAPVQRNARPRRVLRHLGRRAHHLQRDPRIHANARHPGAGPRRRRNAVHVDHLAQAARRAGKPSRTSASFPTTTSRIRRVTNSHSSEPGAPSRGRYASISLWVENLPPDAGLHHLRVQVGDSLGTVTYIGPLMNDGLQQVSVVLPELEATGLLPVELRWLEQPLAPLATLRVIPPGPSVPCIRSVTDGVNLVADKRIETRHVKMILEEVARPHEIEALGGRPSGGRSGISLHRSAAAEIRSEFPAAGGDRAGTARASGTHRPAPARAGDAGGHFVTD